MPPANRSRPKPRNKAEPVALTAVTPSAIAGQLPANWYVTPMVVLDKPEPIRRQSKRK